jgi:hypothetical protein
MAMFNLHLVIWRFLFAVLMIVSIPSLILATDWYVRPAGSGYGSGDGMSYDNAWSGFSSIIWGPGGIRDGDQLYVCGTHSEALTITASGSPGKEIYIRGDSPREPGIIDPAYNSPNCLVMTDRSYVAVEGLTLKRSASQAIMMQGTTNCEVSRCAFSLIGSKAGGSYAIDGTYAGGARILNNRLTNAEGGFNAHGIIINSGTGNPAVSRVTGNRIDGLNGDGITAGNNVIILDNIISNLLNTEVHSDGIVVQGSNVAVTQNTVYDCTQNIYVDAFDYGTASTSVCNEVAIWSNLIYGTASGARIGVIGISVDVETGGGANIGSLKIYNNTIVDCSLSGMKILDRSPEGSKLRNPDIRNNILVNNGGNNRQFHFGGHLPDGLILDNNLTLNTAYDGGAPQTYFWYDSPRTLSEMQALGFETHGVSQVQPVFVRYEYFGNGNDLRPSPGSPAVGSGINLGLDYTKDRDGKVRPSQSGWDLGCFEVSGGS